MEKKLVGEDLVTSLKGRESKLKLNYIGIHNIPQEVADKYMVQDLYYYHLLINHLSLEKLELLKKTGKINPVGSKTVLLPTENWPVVTNTHKPVSCLVSKGYISTQWDRFVRLC